MRSVKVISTFIISLSLASCGSLKSLGDQITDLSGTNQNEKPKEEDVQKPLPPKEVPEVKQYKIAVV